MEKVLFVLDMKSKSNHIVYYDRTDEFDLPDAVEYALKEINLTIVGTLVNDICSNLKKGVPFLVRGRYSFELIDDNWN